MSDSAPIWDSGAPIRRKWQRWTPDRVKALKTAWADENMRVPEIAALLDTSPGAIYLQAGKLDLPKRPKGPKAPRTRVRTSILTDRSGQRRFMGVESTGHARIKLQEHHPAIHAGTTLFPSTVLPPIEAKRVLKSGKNSRKIGEIVSKGRWKGMHIYTLTLEERHTCPRSCKEWSTCYGNNMHMAQRIHDDGTLEDYLRRELTHLAFAHPKGFVVRLHVLGDFYSVDYARFWREALKSIPELHIFGFTARPPSDPIGAELLSIRVDYHDRFCMRWSGYSYETDCSEVVEKPEDGTGIPCPAEKDPERCCATCGLCWQTDRTITFLRH